MRLTRLMKLLAVTGAMASAPLFAQSASDMQDQGMDQGMQNQGMQDQGAQGAGTHNQRSAGMQNQNAPWANQQASLDAVKKLQQTLTQKGYNPGKEDGLLGPKTESALRNFQESQGLQASGKIDAETLNALGIDKSEFAAFGIKEDSSGQMSPENMNQGPSTPESGGGMPESSGGAGGTTSGQSGMPDSQTR